MLSNVHVVALHGVVYGKALRAVYMNVCMFNYTNVIALDDVKIDSRIVDAQNVI